MTITASAGTAPRQLRSYQTEAVAAVEADWAAGTSRVGVVLPTGAGKSTVIGKLAANAYHEGKRVVLLAHRAELLDQMIRDMRAVDPTIPASDIGIVRAEHDDHHAPIVAATLQTLGTASRLKALGERDVILWDEVHHAGAESWNATFRELGGYDTALMAGFTATMHRAASSRVGLGDIIEKVSYERDLTWAITNGFLVHPQGLTVRVANLNALDDVRTVAGDFHQGELAAVMEAATSYVVDAVTEHAADRRPIIFAASVDAAHQIAESLSAADYPAVAVTGEQSYEVRQGKYAAYRSGLTRALVTVMVLTEGADFPMCDAVVLARPTRSRNLYSQMVGRALRLYDGKDDALVLDLSGSTRSMRLVSLTELLPGAAVAAVTETGELIDPADEPEPTTARTRVRRQGPVDMMSIDLLGGDADSLWLETPAGVPFISLRDGDVVFLWPYDGRRGAADADPSKAWAVGHINTRTKAGGWTDGGDTPVYVDLPLAVQKAEAWIVNVSRHEMPSRGASWRRSQAPSDAQLRVARGLHIVGADQMTKAAISDEISIKYAARVLDPAMEVEA
jgi:superfamily II DNA or RNA helicase